MIPLLTQSVHDKLLVARRAGKSVVDVSLDLERSLATVELLADSWVHAGQHYPYLEKCKERTIYFWHEGQFEVASRYSGSLIKLIPTEWGAPTFEIDGIKMLPTAKISPFVDAEHKVSLIQPRGKTILDTCGGLGYFAAWCIRNQASRILSYEKNPDVIWLRSINPWSPQLGESDIRDVLTLTQGDVVEHIGTLADESMDAVLHDPPRFGIAGELYSQIFYDHLARVLKRNGKLFHYTGTPNKLTTGRDVPDEVAKRLRQAGFVTELHGDGVLAVKKSRIRNT